MDEDHIPRRAQDESWACHCDDSAGEDVREEQDGKDSHRTENRTTKEIFATCWPHMSVSKGTSAHRSLSLSLSGCSIQQRPQLESVN